jgi:hypothetical protein
MNIITLKSSTNNARSAKGCFGSKAGTEREICAVIPRPVRHGWLIGRWRVRAPSRSHDHALFRTFVHDSNTVATDMDCMSEPYFGIRSFHLTLQGLVRFRIRNLFDLKKNNAPIYLLPNEVKYFRVSTLIFPFSQASRTELAVKANYSYLIR